MIACVAVVHLAINHFVTLPTPKLSFTQQNGQIQSLVNMMKAIVLESPGDPTALQLQEIAKPSPRAGWVLIKIKAFGLNRSEMFTLRDTLPVFSCPEFWELSALVLSKLPLTLRFNPVRKSRRLWEAWDGHLMVAMPNTPVSRKLVSFRLRVISTEQC